ncbi:hypothetical protein FP744_10005755 [Trichoderma asperellum]
MESLELLFKDPPPKLPLAQGSWVNGQKPIKVDSADLGIKHYVDLAFSIADSPLSVVPFDVFCRLGFVMGRCEYEEYEVDAPGEEILPRFLHGRTILCMVEPASWEEIARAVARIEMMNRTAEAKRSMNVQVGLFEHEVDVSDS